MTHGGNLARGQSHNFRRIREFSDFENFNGAIAQLFILSGRWLRSIRPIFLILGVILLCLVKFGFDLHGNGDIRASAAALPGAANYMSPALLGSLAYRGLNLSLVSWVIFTLTLSVATAVLLVTHVARFGRAGTWRIALFLVTTWPMLAVAFQQAGHYQALLIFTVSVSLIARSRWLQGAFALMATLSLPEQALLGYASLLVLSFIPQFAHWRIVAGVGVVAGFCATIAAGIWLGASGVESRAAIALPLVEQGIRYSISEGWLGVVAWWGAWWFLIILFLLGMNPKQRWFFSLGSIVIPGLSTITTLDGTRVFVGVATPVAVVCLLTYLGALAPPKSVAHARTNNEAPKCPDEGGEGSNVKIEGPLGFWGILAMTFPSLVVEWDLGVEAPWRSILEIAGRLSAG